MENQEKNETISKAVDGEKIKRVWEKMNENERFGLKFGLFPAWTLAENLTKEESVRLMKMYEEQTRN
jgi:hypothetical protein